MISGKNTRLLVAWKTFPQGKVDGTRRPAAEITSAPVPQLDVEALASEDGVPEATKPPVSLKLL
jgi:hypothetical protein